MKDYSKHKDPTTKEQIAERFKFLDESEKAAIIEKIADVQLLLDIAVDTHNPKALERFTDIASDENLLAEFAIKYEWMVGDSWNHGRYVLEQINSEELLRKIYLEAKDSDIIDDAREKFLKLYGASCSEEEIKVFFKYSEEEDRYQLSQYEE